jgi:hypothetical protein
MMFAQEPMPVVLHRDVGGGATAIKHP